ncbi:hypothetical protein HMPREF1155_0380 [Slackia sp. CM382]|nr:hypothetical protein HMPREF1155_0380 [Slackia sp. CM382]
MPARRRYNPRVRRGIVRPHARIRMRRGNRERYEGRRGRGRLRRAAYA